MRQIESIMYTQKYLLENRLILQCVVYVTINKMISEHHFNRRTYIHVGYNNFLGFFLQHFHNKQNDELFLYFTINAGKTLVKSVLELIVVFS